MAAENIGAQTLIAPNSPSKSFPPALAAKKSPSTQRVNPCSTYGAGFVQIPGSDACVKIGGSVTVEGATH
jgi:Porin subfamily